MAWCALNKDSSTVGGGRHRNGPAMPLVVSVKVLSGVKAALFGVMRPGG